MTNIQISYKVGTVVFSPGTFLFYGLNISQGEDFAITIDGDEKLYSYEGYPISHLRRKDVGEGLSAIEIKGFGSINTSIGCLGIAASPFCAFYSSYLQQKNSDPTVHDLIAQINVLRLLKKLGTSTSYKRPENGIDYSPTIVMFADASRKNDVGQLCYIGGILFGELATGSVYHTLSWTSHKPKRPVKSIGSAEIYAAGEAIDEGKVLAKAYERLLGVKTHLWVVVDSRDLFTTLSTCRN